MKSQEISLFTILPILFFLTSEILGLTIPELQTQQEATSPLLKRPFVPLKDRLPPYGKQYLIIDNPLIPNSNCIEYIKHILSPASTTSRNLPSHLSHCTTIPSSEYTDQRIKVTGSIYCETSYYSALYSDAFYAAKALKETAGKGKWQCYSDDPNVQCRLVRSWATSNIYYCRNMAFPVGSGFECWVSGFFAEALAKRCIWRDPNQGGVEKAGGVVEINSPDPKGYVVLRHS